MLFKMKKMKTIILILLTSLLSFNIYSQTGRYPGLYSQDYDEIFEALDQIIDNHDREAIEILHSLILDQTPYIQLNYLKTLSNLKDEEILTFTNEFIDRAEGFEMHEYRENPLEMKVEAAKIMIQNGDFSTVEYFFEYFDLYKPELNLLQRDILILFPVIASNVPSALNQIKIGLLYVFYNSTISENRFFALNTFKEIFVDSVLYLAITGITDDDYSIRNLSLDFLVEYKYQNLNNVLKDRLLVDPGRSMRTEIVHYLLEEFGAPSDLKFVIDYNPKETHPTSKSLIGFYIQKFIPPKPASLNWSGLITKLLSYTDEMFQYGWIQNEEARDYYIQKLNAVKESVENNNATAEACTIINEQLLPKAKQGLKEKLITTEGYKFLHYYTIYIKEEIEKEFGLCD